MWYCTGHGIVTVGAWRRMSVNVIALSALGHHTLFRSSPRESVRVSSSLAYSYTLTPLFKPSPPPPSSSSPSPLTVRPPDDDMFEDDIEDDVGVGTMDLPSAPAGVVQGQVVDEQPEGKIGVDEYGLPVAN